MDTPVGPVTLNVAVPVVIENKELAASSLFQLLRMTFVWKSCPNSLSIILREKVPESGNLYLACNEWLHRQREFEVLDKCFPKREVKGKHGGKTGNADPLSTEAPPFGLAQGRP